LGATGKMTERSYNFALTRRKQKEHAMVLFSISGKALRFKLLVNQFIHRKCPWVCHRDYSKRYSVLFYNHYNIYINSLMPGVIKFKFEFSFTRIVFLDLEIFQEDGALKKSLHIKPTNKQLFLDYNSYHPQHCKHSLPYSQALRVVEICTLECDREETLKNLNSKFKEMNYPSEIVDSQFEKARKKERRKRIYQYQSTSA
jgi:hypothetical protein